MGAKKNKRISGNTVLDNLGEIEDALDDGVDHAEVGKQITAFMKKVDRLFIRQSKYMYDNNETTDCLLEFLDKYPELFVTEYGETNRDMIKWALNQNMQKNRELIDKIQEVEKRLGVDIHKLW